MKEMADLKKVKKPARPSATCRKHPKHQQSPGVCSVCLTKKLSKLATSTGKSFRRSSNIMADSSSSSSLSSASSYYSSSSSLSSVSSYYSSSTSSPSTPLQGFGCLTTATLIKGKPKLTNRRSSTAFFRRFRGKEEGVEQKSKDGIWSKLIGHSRRKQMIVDSQT